jgi:hypothetical protein
MNWQEVADIIVSNHLTKDDVLFVAHEDIESIQLLDAHYRDGSSLHVKVQLNFRPKIETIEIRIA